MSVLSMPLGRYLPVASPVHRRDARLKLSASLGYVAALFLVGGRPGLVFLALGLAGVIALSRVPAGLLWRGLRPLIILVLLTAALQAFGYPGEPLVELGPVDLTREGVERGAFFASRLILLLTAGALLTFTTSAVALTDGVEWLLRPLRYVGINSHELAMMMTIALRFIPTLLEEFDDLIKAQRARGIELSARNPGLLARALVPLAVPLFVLGFRRADDLAVAMLSRCYRGGEGRTRYRAPRFSPADAVAAAVIIGWLLVAVLWGRV